MKYPTNTKSILTLSVVTGLLLSCYQDRTNFREQFLKIKEVTEVEAYTEYDGHRFADLKLVNNGSLSLSLFDSRIFSEAEFIGLDSIGGSSIYCWNPDDLTTQVIGFNVVDFARNTSLPSIRNIEDLAINYDVVLAKVRSELPSSKQDRKLFSFRMPRSQKQAMFVCNLAN